MTKRNDALKRKLPRYQQFDGVLQAVLFRLLTVYVAETHVVLGKQVARKDAERKRIRTHGFGR